MEAAPDRDRASVSIRPYTAADAQATLDVFLAAVTETAARDYSPEQIAAWARVEQRDLREWHRARAALDTIVAVIDEEVVGVSDVSRDGYIDMMFVSPKVGRRGVATALLSAVERMAAQADVGVLSADVSVTARPFFGAHGFVMDAEQHPIVRGVRMTNFRMVKSFVAVTF